MNRVGNAARLVRNNWKKTVFFSGVTVYGASWYKKRLQDTELLAKCCREALTYGSVTQDVKDKNYHVTVILNPAASSGKGRKLFNQYCAPLLHLAGFKVSVQLTEGREEAKKLMMIIENTDAVLVAGGDGTLMEVATGIMRRSDVDTFCTIPIGILPVGETNTLANRLFPGSDDVKRMTDATMAVIKQLTRPVSLIEVENLSENEQFKGKKVHGFIGLQFGAWREAANRVDKYWFFPGLKQRVCYVFSYLTAHKDINWDWPLTLNFTDTHTVTHQVEEPSRGGGGIFAMFSATKKTPKIVEKTETRQVWQPDDESISSVAQVDVQLTADNQLDTKLFPNSFSFSEFVEEGWRRIFRAADSSHLTPREIITEHLKLETNIDLENPLCMSFDGDEIELVGPIRVSVLPDKLNFFCREEDSPQPSLVDALAAASSARRWTPLTGTGGCASTVGGASCSLVSKQQRTF